MSVYMRKKVTFLPESSARKCSEFLPLQSLKITVKDELTQLDEPKCLYGEKLLQLGSRVTLPPKNGNPARRVTLLAEPTFCF